MPLGPKPLGERAMIPPECQARRRAAHAGPGAFEAPPQPAGARPDQPRPTHSKSLKNTPPESHARRSIRQIAQLGFACTITPATGETVSV